MAVEKYIPTGKPVNVFKLGLVVFISLSASNSQFMKAVLSNPQFAKYKNNPFCYHACTTMATFAGTKLLASKVRNLVLPYLGVHYREAL